WRCPHTRGERSLAGGAGRRTPIVAVEVARPRPAFHYLRPTLLVAFRRVRRLREPHGRAVQPGTRLANSAERRPGPLRLAVPADAGHVPLARQPRSRHPRGRPFG